MMKKGDKIILSIIIVLIAIGFGIKYYSGRNKEGIASIEIDGKVYGTYDLKRSENKKFDLKLPDNEHSTVEINNGRIRIYEANCPDKVCVRTGWISKPGEVIVCLPYKIIVKISGNKQDVDVNAF
jgi:Uncharacterized protein conserved in bacteria